MATSCALLGELAVVQPHGTRIDAAADHVVEVDQEAGGVDWRGVVVARPALVGDDGAHEVLVGLDLRLGGWRRAAVGLVADVGAVAAKRPFPLEDVIAVQVDAISGCCRIQRRPDAGSEPAMLLLPFLRQYQGLPS